MLIQFERFHHCDVKVCLILLTFLFVLKLWTFQYIGPLNFLLDIFDLFWTLDLADGIHDNRSCPSVSYLGNCSRMRVGILCAPTTTHHYRLLPNTTHLKFNDLSQLPITTHHYPSLPTTTQLKTLLNTTFQLLPVLTHDYPPLST